MEYGSKDVAASAIKLALTTDRESEKKLKDKLLSIGIKGVAVDFGGDFISSVNKVIERTVVAARREGLIGEHHNEAGAVAGAAREALSQIMPKAIGLNIGGKIGIARYTDHVSVCIFSGIGLLNLNEIAIGLGHRAL